MSLRSYHAQVSVSLLTMTTKERLKYIAFSLIPVIVLFGGAEGAIRLAGLDAPVLAAGGMARVFHAAIMQTDIDLGWSLKPNVSVRIDKGYTVTTNDLGLRAERIPVRKGGEYRILSLGESSTFGFGVNDGETYSRLLERTLNRTHRGRRIRVINAGVPGYSSTQSLLFLEKRGIRLQPDLVLFYHEYNDYFPTTFRDAWVTGVDVFRTDREIYASRVARISRILSTYSAVYRFLSNRYASLQLRRFDASRIDRTHIQDPLTRIGLPGFLEAFWQPYQRTGRKRTWQPVSGLAQELIGRRVTEEERRQNLSELASFCRKRGIALIIIHPSYRPSVRHRCVLTEFCRERHVPMFEAYDSLHPGGARSDDLFLEDVHPSPRGHRALADALAAFIDRSALIPGAGTSR